MTQPSPAANSLPLGRRWLEYSKEAGNLHRPYPESPAAWRAAWALNAMMFWWTLYWLDSRDVGSGARGETGRGEAKRRRAKKNTIFRMMREQASVYTMMLTMME